MKRIASVAAALLALSLVLTGCDELPGSSANPSGSNTPASNTPASNTPASYTPAGRPNGASEYADLLSQGEYEEGEDEDGFLNDVMHTRWFNFLIDEAYTTSTYGDGDDAYTAPEGSQLLVVHIAMKNTTRLSQSMSDVDFQAQWLDDSEDAFAFPITTDDQPARNQPQTDHQLSDTQLPVTYELAVNEVRDGDLIFVVPAALPTQDEDGNPIPANVDETGAALPNKDFSVSFVEFFGYDDDDEPMYGDYYFVYFTAESR